MNTSCMDTGSIDMLHFHVADTRFCVNLSQTSRVLPLVALQAIPDAPDYIAGLLNLHGTSVPVVDLIYRLNLPHKRPYKLSACIVLCQVDGKTVGLIADNVDQVGTVEPDMIQLQNLFNGTNPPLLGLVESMQGMATWLSLEPVLGFDFAIPDDHMASDYHDILSLFSDKTA